jgi:UvrD/REP helicase N-terminal domain
VDCNSLEALNSALGSTYISKEDVVAAIGTKSGEDRRRTKGFRGWVSTRNARVHLECNRMGKAVIFAAAGAGKTERIIQEALAEPRRRVLITTYTNRNAQQITDRLIERCGLVPDSIRVETRFRFRLREAIKPYQSALTTPFRTQSINFVSDPSIRAKGRRR